MLWAADGARSIFIVHLPTWAKEVREGVSAVFSLGMRVEPEEFVPCAKQFLMLWVWGKLKPKVKGQEGALAFGRRSWCGNLSCRWISLADLRVAFPLERN